MTDKYRNLLGKRIGRGSGRDVYLHRTDPSLVIKVATRRHTLQTEFSNGMHPNKYEVKVWTNMPKEYRGYFSPIVEYSKDRKYVVQKRTMEITEQEWADCPDAPVFAYLTKDPHRSNVGRLNGRIVLHDYGSSVFDFDNWKEKK